MAYPMGRSGCSQWAGLTASRALHPECAPAGRGLCGGTVPGMAGDGHSSESKFSETRTTGSSTTEVKTRKLRLGAARSPVPRSGCCRARARGSGFRAERAFCWSKRLRLRSHLLTRLSVGRRLAALGRMIVALSGDIRSWRLCLCRGRTAPVGVSKDEVGTLQGPRGAVKAFVSRGQ